MTREALEVEALAKPKATRESHLVLCRRTLISQDAILRSPTAPTPGTGGGTDIAAKLVETTQVPTNPKHMIPNCMSSCFVRVSGFRLASCLPPLLAWAGTGYGISSAYRWSFYSPYPRIQAEAQAWMC